MRKLDHSDIIQLLKIENAIAISPWSAETFKMCFDAGYLGWGLEDENELFAFVFISLNHEECHILNIAIQREYQGKGFGKQLLESILAHSKEVGAKIAYLEVRKTNSRAIRLYQNMQFQVIGERKDYYKTAGGVEDALVFAKGL